MSVSQKSKWAVQRRSKQTFSKTVPKEFSCGIYYLTGIALVKRGWLEMHKLRLVTLSGVKIFV